MTEQEKLLRRELYALESDIDRGHEWIEIHEAFGDQETVDQARLDIEVMKSRTLTIYEHIGELE